MFTFLTCSSSQTNQRKGFTMWIFFLALFSMQFSSSLYSQGFTEVYAGSLLPVNYPSVAWGDYDNDGDLDFLLTGADSFYVRTSKIYQNTGSGFTEVYAGSLEGVYYGSVDWGDYDNDGDLDILLTGENSGASYSVTSRIYQNTGSGFTEVFAGSLTDVAYGSVAWGDYDNDGDLDILLTGEGLISAFNSRIYQNTGSGFTEVYAGSLVAVSFGSVAWGDYDNDGDLDILLTGNTDTLGKVSKIYQNTGSGFTEVYAGSLQAVVNCSVAWGDYDNDGDLDILLTGEDGITLGASKIYQNTGSGFTEVYAGSLQSVVNCSVAWGDYDNDGDLDILLTGETDTGKVSKIYQNTGSGFIEVLAGNLTGVIHGDVDWGDYDNDGDLDILLAGAMFANFGNDTLYAKIYQNTVIPLSNMSQQNEKTFNAGPTAPTGLTATSSGSSISFKWNRATDAQTPSPGLTYNLRIGTSSNGVNVQSPMADVNNGYRRVVRMGNTNHDTTWTIHNLDTTQTYYWSVQALNHASAGSSFSTEQTFAFTYTLTTNATQGSISRNPSQSSYTNGSQVVLTATPVTGYHFVNWSGDLSGSENPDTLTMDANKTVTANFAINMYTLSVSGDHGVVTKSPNQISYDHGTTAQVSQTADRAYIFTGWSGDATGANNPLSVTMDGNKTIQANYIINSAFEYPYRTVKYESWALAKDGKDKLLSVKRKADKAFFKFNLVADSTRILYLEFPAEASGAITFGKLKTDTVANFTTTKKKFRDTLTTISMGDTIQIDGVAMQGKKVQVKYAWGKAKTVTMKADSLYKVNRVGLPMPNLHNIGEELFPKGFGQTGVYFANGLLIGIPQGLKKANSVIHPKYADVQKSFVKGIKNGYRLHSDTLDARCLDSLDGTKKKAMSSQQKSLPPDKMDNKLFAEVLTLKLNIAASATDKFPAGIGQLTFDDLSNVSNPFNEMMVDSIATKADSMLSCLNTSPGATLSELYETVQMINTAFADTTIDTLSFGSKTRLTGVRTLLDVDYLRPTPGVIPRIVQSFDVASEQPEEFRLYQNYPNPFNPSTVIRYQLPADSRVTLKVFNVLGQEVATIVDGMQEAGFKTHEWNASQFASGVYYYRLVAGEFTAMRAMVVMK